MYPSILTLLHLKRNRGHRFLCHMFTKVSLVYVLTQAMGFKTLFPGKSVTAAILYEPDSADDIDDDDPDEDLDI
jgi:hypothetical protein